MKNFNVIRDDLLNLVSSHKSTSHGQYVSRDGYKDDELVWIIDAQFHTIYFRHEHHKILFQLKYG